MSKKEPKFEAGFGPSQSWRDKVRNFALDKYGAEGKRIIDNVLGPSEEDMALNYLQRTYGSELPEGVNVNRPMSDMLKYGMSDFGLVDAALFGMSAGASAIPRGIGTASAITESSLLAGDAVGEYQKGNNLGAAFMGTMVGAPPLLRYTLGRTPPPKGQMEFQFQNVPDLKRRKFSQGLGLGIAGLGALSMMPGSFFRNFAPSAGKVAAKAAASIPNVTTRFNMMRALKDALGDIDYTKGILSDMKRIGGLDHKEVLNQVFKVPKENVDRIIIEGSTNPEFLARYKDVPGYQTADDWINMKYEYELFDTFDDLARLEKQVSFKEFNKIFDAKAAEMKMPSNQKVQATVNDMLANEADLYIWNSPEFRKAAFKQYKVLETVAEYPGAYKAKDLEAIAKRMQEIFPKGHYDSKTNMSAYEMYPNYTDELSDEYFKLYGEAIRKADELINKGTYNDVDRLVDSMNALEDSDLEILHKSPLP